MKERMHLVLHFTQSRHPNKDTEAHPGQVAQLFVVSDPAPIGWGFDSQLENTPGVWVLFPFKAQHAGGSQSMSVRLSPPLLFVPRLIYTLLSYGH